MFETMAEWFATTWLGSTDLGIAEWFARISAFELVLLLVNVVLLLMSGWLHRNLPQKNPELEEEYKSRLRIFRAINVLSIVLVVGLGGIWPTADKTIVQQILAELMIIYSAYLVYHIMVYVIRRKFGQVRQVSGEVHLVDTYNSRLLSLLAIVFIFVMALIATIQLFAVNSLLEAGGVVGFIGVMLALTQASWAPDIISGVIILNSRLFEENDVIEIKSGDTDFIGLVFKTRMFHTEFLNLQNNHRVMIRNSILRNMELHNLSKFASVRGLREMVLINIGYDVPAKAVKAMVDEAFGKITNSMDNHIEQQHEIEVRVQEVGDYAVSWAVFYHVKKVRHLLRLRQLVREALLETSIEHNIQLATPNLHQLDTLAGLEQPENSKQPNGQAVLRN